MKSTIALSLLATALSVGTASASADSHRVLERRAAGHALPAKRFVKRTVRHGARAEIPATGYLSVSANASSSTSGESSSFETTISNSSEPVWVDGTALWYQSNGLGGSCKVDYNSTDLLVSLPASFYPSKEVISPLCGEQVLIKDVATGNNVSAIVSDTSSNEYLVLSNSAFLAISPLAIGMLDVQYYFFNSSINTTLPVASSSATPIAPSTAVARVASTQAPTTTQAPQTTAAPQPTTDAYDYASASSASKASADAAWASSSKAAADAAWASSSKAAADASWASSSAAAAAASKSSADAAWASSSSSAAAAAAQTQSSSSGSSASSSSEVFKGGYATYYLQNGNPGHCGTVAQESDKVVALPSVTYANGAHCGQQVVITRTDTGAQVTATVRDSCPTCVNNESLDLSQGAFTAIATESEGMVPIEWHYL